MLSVCEVGRLYGINGKNVEGSRGGGWFGRAFSRDMRILVERLSEGTVAGNEGVGGIERRMEIR